MYTLLIIFDIFKYHDMSARPSKDDHQVVNTHSRNVTKEPPVILNSSPVVSHYYRHGVV